MKIHKLTQEKDFRKILEAKVDINLKIAKILANALDWRVDFNAFKGSKYSIAFPLSSESMINNNQMVSQKKSNLKVPKPYRHDSSKQVTINFATLAAADQGQQIAN